MELPADGPHVDEFDEDIPFLRAAELALELPAGDAAADAQLLAAARGLSDTTRSLHDGRDFVEDVAPRLHRMLDRAVATQRSAACQAALAVALARLCAHSWFFKAADFAPVAATAGRLLQGGLDGGAIQACELLREAANPADDSDTEQEPEEGTGATRPRLLAPLLPRLRALTAAIPADGRGPPAQLGACAALATVAIDQRHDERSDDEEDVPVGEDNDEGGAAAGGAAAAAAAAAADGADGGAAPLPPAQADGAGAGVEAVEPGAGPKTVLATHVLRVIAAGAGEHDANAVAFGPACEALARLLPHHEGEDNSADATHVRDIAFAAGVPARATAFLTSPGKAQLGAAALAYDDAGPQDFGGGCGNAAVDSATVMMVFLARAATEVQFNTHVVGAPLAALVQSFRWHRNHATPGDEEWVELALRQVQQRDPEAWVAAGGDDLEFYLQ